jgi:hypothetical protein
MKIILLAPAFQSGIENAAEQTVITERLALGALQPSPTARGYRR